MQSKWYVALVVQYTKQQQRNTWDKEYQLVEKVFGDLVDQITLLRICIAPVV
jgi:hypothetical protein